MNSMQWAKDSPFPAVYEELTVPAFLAHFADALLDRTGLSAADRVLDVATGTGIVLRRAHARVRGLGRLVGVDLTPAMLRVALEMSAGAPIEYLEADALELPFADGSFDLVTCQQGLQFLPDRPRALREFRRVLSEGGRLVIACWCEIESAPGHRAFADVIATELPALGGAATNPFSLPDGAALEAMLSDAGFAGVAVERVASVARFATAEDFTRSVLEGSPLEIVLRDLPVEERAALSRTVTERISAFWDAPLRLPIATHIAMGIRR